MPSTTTFETIRENMEALIQGLTPNNLARERFHVERGEMELRDWAEKNKPASLRRFAIVEAGARENGEVHNYSNREVYCSVQVIVAYPNDFRYGSQNIQDRADVIEADAYQIRDTIADLSSYVSGQRDADDVSHEIEDGEAATFLIINFDVVYFRSNAA